MKAIVYLRGKTFDTLAIDLPDSWFEIYDTAYLYTKVCEAYPDNDWEDMVCKKVEYNEDYLEITLICS